ncbi:hypothetical protein J1N35_005068 [Gossypium stocksii]|uniref:RNase H type-1 domain-containing protein n=1 Tax=Gossypium stocksii TaxID=47602 RepID=A0A9D4AIM7_9ROSI|nr:hypothetical protein J1N35_005068 [Gossypium stocksii]
MRWAVLQHRPAVLQHQILYHDIKESCCDTEGSFALGLGFCFCLEQKKRTLTVGKGYEQTERNSRVTVFFYAAFDKGPSKSASGLAVRDERGEILVSKIVIHFDIPTPFAAEAHAGLQAIHTEFHFIPRSENDYAHFLAKKSFEEGSRMVPAGEGFEPCSSREGESELKAAKLRDEEPW